MDNQLCSGKFAPVCNLLLVLFCALTLRLVSSDEFFDNIRSFRAEGKLTLTYTLNNEKIEHQLIFQEVLDAQAKRSKLKIGYVSFEPNVYYNMQGMVIKVNDMGRCEGYENGPGDQYKMVPEFDWFVKMTYTQEELAEYFKTHKHELGPTFLAEISTFSKAITTRFDGRKEKYRNIMYNVATQTYSRAKASKIELQAFVPSYRMIDIKETPFLTLKELCKDVMNIRGEKYNVSMVLDIYRLERINFDKIYDLQRLEEDFSLPLGAGCSEFLPVLPRPEIKAQSFIMTYHQFLGQSFVTLAYDNENGYLRRDLYPSGVVSIWDFNEDLLYSVDSQATLSQIIDVHASSSQINDPLEGRPRTSTQACAVLSVADDLLGAAQRPYQKSGHSGAHLDVLQFLGANLLAFIGRSTVRNLPCLVYETIVSEPPAVFGLSIDSSDQKEAKRFDYIVQFYILRTATISMRDNRIAKEFWPAKINLIRRHKATGAVQDIYDSIEVFDFHWGLFGLQKKPSELFMAPECFDVEEEQVRLEMLLEFKGTNIVPPPRDDKMSQLRENKYLFELSLLNDLFKSFQISRLHLTEFELTLRSNDGVASLMLSDRKSDKALKYYGEGELSNEKSSLKDRLTLLGVYDEQSCVSLASHLVNIAMIAYCPYLAGVRVQAQCIAVLNEMAPVIQHEGQRRPENPDDPFEDTSSACRIYSLAAGAPPASGTQNWSKWSKLLHNHEFSFDIEASEMRQLVSYTTRVSRFQVEKKIPLAVIASYRYALEAPKVRSFPMMTYNNIGDCARMCNLDVSCFSYSYCTKPVGRTESLSDSNYVPENEKCLLSSLDIRKSAASSQLLSESKAESNTVKVISSESKYEYSLKRENECKIHEKDYFDSFSETGQTLTLIKMTARDHKIELSLSECTKQALAQEGSSENVVSHTIAYCPETRTCLLDLELFEMIKDLESPADGDDDDNGQSDELNCLVYRRKYQTFFHVSPKVLKQSSDSEEQQFSQLPIALPTVEECARACWIEFGHICASFDYCSSDSLCLINSIAFEDQTLDDKNVTDRRKSTSEKLDRLLEQRAGCLHYERDLRIDQIRQSHASLRHKALDLSLVSGGLLYQQDKWTLARVLVYTLTFCTVSVCFLAGLVLGRRVNERLEGKSIVLPGSNGIANFIRTLTRSSTDNQEDTEKLNSDNAQMMAIQLVEMSSHENGRDAGADELQ